MSSVSPGASTTGGHVPAPAAVHAALQRVLGHPEGSLREDTVLADVGVDRLARVLILDACEQVGIHVDEQRAWAARTVSDLVDAVVTP